MFYSSLFPLKVFHLSVFFSEQKRLRIVDLSSRFSVAELFRTKVEHREVVASCVCALKIFFPLAEEKFFSVEAYGFGAIERAELVVQV